MEDRLGGLSGRLLEAARRRTSPDAEEAAALAGMLCDEYPTNDHRAPVELVASRFGLTDLDTELLTIASAPDLDLRFGAVYQLLLGHGGWRPTTGLAMELSGHGTLSPAGRARLQATKPLLRHRLVEVHGDGPTLLRTLSVPERVVAHLLGDDTPEPDLADRLVEAPARTDEIAHQLARALGTGARLGHLRNRAGAAGLATARGALELLGLGSVMVDLTRQRPSEDIALLARLAVREAGLLGRGLVLIGTDSVLPQDRTPLAVLHDAPIPVLVVDDLAWERGWTRSRLVTAAATPLDLVERTELWLAALDGDASAEQATGAWQNLVGLRMTPEAIAGSLETASVRAAAEDRSITASLMHEAAREQGRARLESAAVRTPPRATLDDLVLPHTTRQSLDELVSWARSREVLMSAGRLTGRGTKGHGVTALFAGPPGTGKTLAAEAVAGELGLELCTVDLSAVVDKYIGETEKHLEQLISEAENLNVVLLFDEADSLFGARSAVSDAKDRYANQGISYLLQRIERFDGLAVLATNLQGNIDPAFARRLHHVIAFPDPDAPTRRRLWEAHLQEVVGQDPADPLDLDWLAESVELAGGSIRNIVMTAAFAAVAERTTSPVTPQPVGMRHVVDAVDREYRKQARRAPARPATS